MYFKLTTLGLFVLLLVDSVMAATLSAVVVDESNQPLEDVVIRLIPLDQQNVQQEPFSGVSSIDQIDKEFVPHVSVLRKGTTVSFPNQDNIRHQIYSFSPAKRFTIPLYKGVAAEVVTFDQTGVVTLGCNIHDWMVGHVLVVDTRYADKTNSDGVVTIEDIIPGKYKMVVWHPLSTLSEAESVREIDVTTVEDHSVTWTVTLRPPTRTRRVMPGSRGPY